MSPVLIKRLDILKPKAFYPFIRWLFLSSLNAVDLDCKDNVLACKIGGTIILRECQVEVYGFSCAYSYKSILKSGDKRAGSDL